MTIPVQSIDYIDPRTRRTRQLLMQAFADLLAEKSFESLTVQEITERATVNRATFYAHFEDKYVLLDAAFADSFQQTIQRKLPPGSGFIPMNLRLLIEGVCEYLEQMQAHCARSIGTQFDSLVERQVKKQLDEILLSWLAKPAGGQFDGQTQAELQATVTSWAIYGAALHWSRGARKEPAQDFARQALPLIMPGLKGQELVAAQEDALVHSG